jgi:hypothetical protein
MTRRRCLTCGQPTTATRCTRCARNNDRTRRPAPADRGYDAAYQADRTAILATNPLCVIGLEGCTITATTLDHDPPLAHFPPGQWRGKYRPACHHCNSTLGGQTRRPT